MTGTLRIGVDLGGTKTTVGLVDETDAILCRRTTPTRGAGGPDVILGDVASLVREVVAAAAAPCRGVGVGSAGTIDRHTGRVLSSTDVLADWAGVDIRARLAELTGLPVEVDNDVNAHAFGELTRGAGAGAASAIFVAAGTGIGAALVVAGRLHRGRHSVAGEIGHLPAPMAAGRVCSCGRPGHLEAVAAGPAMVRAYAARVAPGGQPSAAFEGSLPDVVVRAKQGDRDAVETVVEGARALGQAIGGLLNSIDPEIVVVGGGVAAIGELWWQPMLEAAAADSIAPVRATPILPSALGADAPLVGAAALLEEAL